jgi:hypothetical protein
MIYIKPGTYIKFDIFFRLKKNYLNMEMHNDINYIDFLSDDWHIGDIIKIL